MNIAIAVDLSVESHFAVRWALDLRDRMRDQDRPVRLFAISVPADTKPFEFSSLAGYSKSTVHDAGLHRRITHQIRHFLETVDRDVDDIEITVVEGEPADLIADFCRLRNIDWLVTGQSDMDGFSRLVLGSTVHRLIDRVPCKMAIIDRGHPRLQPPLDFVVGVDFLPGSEAALLRCAGLAEITGAHIHLVHALRDAPTGTAHSGLVNYVAPTDVAQLTADAQQGLELMMDEVQKRHPSIEYSTLVHSGRAKNVLFDYIARHNIDVAFVGRILHSTLEKWALGSVSRTLVKRMPTTMALVPPTE